MPEAKFRIDDVRKKMKRLGYHKVITKVTCRILKAEHWYAHACPDKGECIDAYGVTRDEALAVLMDIAKGKARRAREQERT